MSMIAAPYMLILGDARLMVRRGYGEQSQGKSKSIGPSQPPS